MKKCILTCVCFFVVVCSLFAVTDYTIRSGYTLSNSVVYGFNPMRVSSSIEWMYPVRGKNVTHGFGFQVMLDFKDPENTIVPCTGYVFNYGWDRIQFNMLCGITGFTECNHDEYGNPYHENWTGIGVRLGGLFYFDDSATYGIALDTTSSLCMELEDDVRFDYRISATVSGVLTLRGWSIDERKNYEGGIR